ncbi:SDR family NAD(P)-dependent oxidoreductase [Nocardia sp. CWNU-33]|uniref:SDR family NAD(P)-dependent oxidoreductase n=1 Tax=Nocardia sp. CWNU-33 TaxID=3392117 RepID=UPI00398EFB82
MADDGYGLRVLLTRALRRIQELEAQRHTHEPIAVVGIGCRFPGGADNPDNYWDLLISGRDAIVEVPADRWPITDPAPQSGLRRAGLLDAPIDAIDTEFFGIAPREAAAMDPQQRLVLEVAWEAMEDAALLPESAASTRTGVFLGVSWQEYQRTITPDWVRSVDAHTLTGTMSSVVAGRVAYLLGLRGPVVALDTACSSSLVAVHQACRSLRSGECDVALAGGVNLLQSELTSAALSRMGALSADGRCRPFDARANGYVRGEGAGVIVLKRLSRAIADGDEIRALVRGSSVNHDGRSMGLTAPNPVAQRELLRAALADAGCDAAQIGYVETHGTGTPLGDPIEIEALSEVLGAPRSDESVCLLGSVKSQIGHLEAAAGIAGLIKTVLLLQRGQILRQREFDTLNPRIALDGTALAVPTRDVEWPEADRPRLAGVSSFGFAGTNAHVVLEAAAASTESVTVPEMPAVLALSARSEAALEALSARYGSALARTKLPFADIGATAALGRTHFAHRRAIVASTSAEAASRLAAPQHRVGLPQERNPRVAMLFTGQGAQYAGMGAALYERHPVFRAALDRCDDILGVLPGGLRLRALLFDVSDEVLTRTEYAQPALFAVEWACVELWAAWGVRPDVVLGHSLGELVAATVAGVLDPEEGLRLAAERGRLMQAVSQQGAMAAVFGAQAEFADLLAELAPSLAVAALNGPRQFVVSGTEAAVRRVRELAAERAIRAISLPGSTAFHSPLLDPILDDFEAKAAELVAEPSRITSIPLVSNVTGQLLEVAAMNAGYWREHARGTVRFAEGMRTVADFDVDAYLEVGPHPVLLDFGRQVDPEAMRLPSLRRSSSDDTTILTSLGEIYCAGADVNWTAVVPVPARRRNGLPTYPFARERQAPPLSADAQVDTGYLAEHRFQDRSVVPAAYLAWAALRAAGADCELVDFVVARPVPLDQLAAPVVDAADDRIDIRFCVEPGRAAAVSASAVRWERTRPGDTTDLAAAEHSDAAEWDVAEFYRNCTEAGLTFGPRFRWIEQLRAGGDFMLAKLSRPAELADEPQALLPYLLDAAVQTGLALVTWQGDTGQLPVGIGRLRVHRTDEVETAWALATRTGRTNRIRVFDDDGDLICDIEDVWYAKTRFGRSAHEQVVMPDLVHLSAWERTVAEPGVVAPNSWLVIGIGEQPDRLAEALRKAGHPAVRIDRTADRTAIAGMLGEAGRAVVYLGDAEADDSAIAARVETELAVEVVQSLARIAHDGPLYLVTTAGVAVTPGERVRPAAAALCAFGAVVRTELPELRCRLIDLPDRARSDDRRLVAELRTAAVDPTIALRGRDRYAPRSVAPGDSAGLNDPDTTHRADGLRAPRLPEFSGAMELDRAAAYLITGGLGALGLLAARTLAEAGAGTVVLAGRHGPNAQAAAAIAGISVLGARVETVQVDVADRDALSTLISRFGDRLPRLAGVVHCAGALDDALLIEQSPERVRRVFAGKADGAWNLHELTAAHALDLFVLFSSASATVGVAGQGNYAAANAYLDALARVRIAGGMAALSIQWGPWADTGMARGLNAAARRAWERHGVAQLDVEDGVRTLKSLLAVDGVVAVYPPALATRSIVATQPASAAYPPVTDFLATVRAHATTALGRKTPVADRTPLREFGLDSMIAVELRNTLSSELGVRLPATLLFDHPTVAAVADEIARLEAEQTVPRAAGKAVREPDHQTTFAATDEAELAAATHEPDRATAPTFAGAERVTASARPEEDGRPEVEGRQVQDVAGSSEYDDAIAIIGMGCRYPGGVRSPGDLWRLVSEETDAVTEVPGDRWDVEAYFDADPDVEGKTYTRWGGFVDGVEEFDAGFFDISIGEARMLDPQQRLLLETSWEALEHAGYSADRLTGSRTGVFVGVMSTDYAERMARAGVAPNAWFGTGNLASIASGRLSYFLGVNGPSLTIDTACSSSLVTVHLAMQSLRRGESDLALACGATVVLTPSLDIYFARARGLAADGRCKSFDARADGVVWSDGAGTLVLKRLSDARRDGDRVLALVRGSAVNSDGRSQGLSAPNGPAQEKVIRAALADATLTASDIDYVETHGTGTALGDPIEVNALASALTSERPDSTPLLIGSVKSNFGHTQAAAGIANIIKVVESMRHDRIPPSLHFRSGNPHIDWDDIGVRVVAKERAWPRSARPRRAGVSAFGISGTNAHVVLEEAPVSPHTDTLDHTRGHLLALSAKSADGLRELAGRYRDLLIADPDTRLHDLCACANTGRTHFAARVAIIVDTTAQLRAALEQVATGSSAAGTVADRATGSGELSTMARRYVEGADIDWHAVHSDRTWRRIELPTYPFQRKRHWLDLTPTRPAGDDPREQPVGKLSTSVLAVEPEMFSGHQLHGAPTVPAAWMVAQLARIAAELPGADRWEITHVRLTSPLTVPSVGTVEIRIEAVAAGYEVRFVSTSGIEPESNPFARAALHAAARHREPAPSGSWLRQAARRPLHHVPLDDRDARYGAAWAAYYGRVAEWGLWLSEDYRCAAEFRRISATESETSLWASASESVSLDPVLLDACLHSIVLTADPDTLYLPVSIDRITLSDSECAAGDLVRCRVRVTDRGARVIVGDATLIDSDGGTIATIGGACLIAAGSAAAARDAVGPRDAEALRGTAALGHAESLRDTEGPGDAEALRNATAPRGAPTVLRGETAGPEYATVPWGARTPALRVETAGPEHAAARIERLFHRLQWTPIAIGEQLPVGKGAADRWLVFSDGPTGDAVAAGLSARNIEISVLRPEDVLGERLSIEPGEGNFAALLSGPPLGGIVYAWTTGSAADRVGTVLRLARALDGADRVPSTLWLLTVGAQRVSGADRPDPEQAMMWGLGRTLATEHPEFDCRLVDLEAAGAVDTALVTAGFVAGIEDRELAVRDGRWHAAHLTDGVLDSDVADNFHLVAHRSGDLGRLRWDSTARRAPAPGEVEIAVEATGLNPRDLWLALGTHPDAPAPLGLDCSGRVTALGAGVTKFRVGDRVVALASGSFARYVTVDHRLVAPLPARMTFTEGATIPAAFVTAWYGLFEVAGVRMGEHVLVHAPANGIGMAAVQLAGWAGAHVLGTVALSRWAAGVGLDIPQVDTWRTHGVGDQLHALTDGRGVDVVFNAIAGEFTASAAKIVGSHGRFIDIDDPGQSRREDGAQAGRGIDYRVVDPNSADPERLGTILRTVLELFDNGTLAVRDQPAVYEADDAQTAFRSLWRHHHSGPITLQSKTTRATANGIRTVAGTGTYLVTGGFGGLGAAAARWLAARGARTVLLVGRRGPDDAGDRLVASLRADGLHVVTRQVDVVDRAAVAELLAGFEESGLPPLRGVVHCAGVLDDGVVTELSWRRFQAVLGPKYLAAQHLDELTRGMELDLFITYSSVAGWLGTPGQANYAAANAALDALAWRRRADGLSALSIVWGPFADVGMAAGRPELTQRLDRRGLSPLRVADAAAALDRLLSVDSPCAGVFDFSADRWYTAYPARVSVAAAKRESIPDMRPIDAGATTGQVNVQHPSESAATQRDTGRWVALVERIAMRVLDRTAELDPDLPLHDIGVDSLTGMELRAALATEIGAPLPAGLVFDYPTVRDIAKLLQRKGTDVKLDHSNGASQVAHSDLDQPEIDYRFEGVGTAVRHERDADNVTHIGGEDDDPIVIVGMACRFPGGVRTPEEFWELLWAGRDAITEVPPQRWDIDAFYDPDPAALGAMYTRWGGFVDGADEFDPAFFGIGAAEARAMDPQQRLLLETSWEALERSGRAPGSLAGSRTGVFVGMCFSEYPGTATQATDPASIGAYSVIGSAPSVAAGRVAYALGLQGPAVTLDTACSSSLVAVQSAWDGLRAGRCDLALVSGVNLQLAPETTIGFCRLASLSPDGRSRAFDADADGYVRADGCGVLVLTRLSAAREHGDRVLAVVRGIGVNHDGRSNGLTAPNGPAQQRVIRDALGQAGIRPGEVDYVEAHGTGTPLGDPIEAAALAEVYGEHRTVPLLIGSVKTNIGHTEGAAGVAGVIKAVLMVQHAMIPPSLHFHTPNPLIDWSGLPLEVVREPRAWPQTGRRRTVGVSSFGMSGTNAHLILQQATPEPVRRHIASAPQVLVVSARDDAALIESANGWADCLSGTVGELADFAYTSATGRTHFEERLAVVAATADTAAARLRAAAADARSVLRGRVERASAAPKIAVLFTGQGSQYPGMARGLFETEPVFRRTLQHCDDVLGPISDGMGLLDALYGDRASADTLARTVFTQPALFAVEWALWELWRDWGIVPAAVLGHSVGEYVAACAAEAMRVDDALRLIAVRGRLMQSLPDGGGMLAVEADSAALAPALERYAPAAAIAGFNSPAQVVVAGPRSTLGLLQDDLAAAGIRATALTVSHAFHSPLMDPILDDLAEAARRTVLRDPAIPMISNVTGAPVRAGELTAEYWARQARQPVRFVQGMRALTELGIGTFLEIGPQPTLSALGSRAIEGPARFVAALRRGRDDREMTADALAQLYVGGVAIDWERVHRPHAPRRVLAPTYPFQRQRYWVDQPRKPMAPSPNEPDAAAHRLGDDLHRPTAATSTAAVHTPLPYLPRRLDLPGDVTHFAMTLAPVAPRYLSDHVVDHDVVVPAAWFVATIVATTREVTGAEVVTIEDLVIASGLMLTADHLVQLRFAPQIAGFIVEVASRVGDGWHTHARAQVSTGAIRTTVEFTVTDLLNRCTAAQSADDFYRMLAVAGLHYGPAFQRVVEVRTGDREAVVRMSDPDADPDADLLQPVLLDAAFQATYAAMAPQAGTHTWVPMAIDRVSVPAVGGRIRYGHVRVLEQTPQLCVADVLLLDEEGAPVLIADGLRVVQTATDRSDARPAVQLSPTTHGEAALQDVYRMAWRDAGPVTEVAAAGRWLVVGTVGGPGDAVAAGLRASGAHCAVARPGPGFGFLADDEFEVDLGIPAAVRALLGAASDGRTPLRGIVYTTPVSAADDMTPDRAQQAVLGALHLVQAAAVSGEPALWLLTRNGQQVDAADRVAPDQSALWGFARSAHLEQHEIGCRIIDLDDRSAADAEAVVAELLSTTPRRQLALRGGKRLLPRLVPAQRSRPEPGRNGFDSAATTQTVLSTEGTVLITGGLGGIGRTLARWFVDRGTRSLVLAGRNAPDAMALQLITELRERGAHIEIRTLDVADRAAVAATLDWIDRELAPLAGVVHLAGVLDDGVIVEQSATRMGRVLAPKLHGAWHLHDLTAPRALRFFLLFSSASAVVGLPGQSSYSAANAFLDGLAELRCAAGLPALSIAWGPWAGTGMVDRLGAGDVQRLARRGYYLLSERRALEILSHTMDSESGALMALPLDLPALRRSGVEVPEVLAGLAAGGTLPPAPTSVAVERRVIHDRTGFDAEMAALVRHCIGLAPDADLDRPLHELGLDSVAAIEIRDELSRAVGHRLPATLAFEYPTPRAVIDLLVQLGTAVQEPVSRRDGVSAVYPIAPVGVSARDSVVQQYEVSAERAAHYSSAAQDEPGRTSVALRGELSASGFVRSSPGSVNTPAHEAVSRQHEVSAPSPADTEALRITGLAPARRERSDEGVGDIAIVGVSGRYPGADGLEEYWRVLLEGRDCITEIPRERWDHSRYFVPDRHNPYTSYTKWGGFLDDVDCFDPLFFAISPREAEVMDPQERLFLQTAWSALEDAGHTRADLARRGLRPEEAGVFVGIMWGTYQMFGAEESRLGRGTLPASTFWSVANRVSHALDFQGPSMAVDTACSSSLTALHLACQSLRTGECRMAVVGGVNLSLHPYKFVALSQGQFASTDGRCRSFGAGGDGYVAGEGVGALVLRPLADAEADGDTIHAVIKGTAVNHGGRVNGFTVPNPTVQAAVIRSALRTGDVDPDSVSYIEAHGTGTALGDPIEIAGLSKVFGGTERAELPIGSVKSNVGHLEAAAGVAALTKVLLQLRHETIVPSLHATPANPNIDFASTRFRIPERPLPWPSGGPGQPRRATISSFGAGGSNANVVLEEYVDQRPVTRWVDDQIVPVSARDADRLTEYVAALDRFLTTQRPNLADLAHTMQVGRLAGSARTAFIARDLDELRAAVRTWVEDAPGARGSARAAADQRIANWLNGAEIDWETVCNNESHRQIPLPTYPFARERYWIPDVVDRNDGPTADDATPSAAPAASVADLGTTVDAGTRARNGQARSATFETIPTGAEAVAVRAERRALVPVWRPTEPGRGDIRDRLPLVLYDSRTPASFVEALRATLGERRLIRVTDAPRDGDLDRTDFAAGAQLGRALLARYSDTDSVIDLCDLAPLPSGHRPTADLGRMGLYQGVIDGRSRALLLLHVAAGTPGTDGPECTPLAGLVAALADEIGDVHTRSVHLVAHRGAVCADPHSLIEILGAECASVGDEAPRVQYQGGRRSTVGLEPVAPRSGLVVDPARTYVVTGGTRGLGAEFAAMLVERGARRLAILGREALPPESEWPGLADSDGPHAAKVRRLSALRDRGIAIRTYFGDLTDEAALTHFVAEVRRELGPIGGVLHCAGAVSVDSPAFVRKTAPAVADVLAPKIAGTAVLAAVLAADRPDFFVLFSSVSAVLPGLAVGLSDYAMANAHLDRFAEAQHANGRTWFRSIEWPSFRGTGFGAVTTSAYRSTELPTMTAAEGFDLLDGILGLPDAPVVLPYHGAPLQLSLHRSKRNAVSGPAVATPAVATPAVDAGAHGGSSRAYRELLRIFSDELKLAPARFEGHKRFDEYGADSVLIASAVRRIEKVTGQPFDPALVLEYPTLDALADLLTDQHPDLFAAPSHPKRAQPHGDPDPRGAVDGGATNGVGPHRTGALPASGNQRIGSVAPIAVVGIGCRLPGGDDPNAFWRMLAAGESGIREVDPARWDPARYYHPTGGPGSTNSKWGGFVDGVDLFDPGFFGISDALAWQMDPLQRLLLEASVLATADAGYHRDELAGRRIGVYAGSRAANYFDRIPVADRHTIVGIGQNFIAARISDYFDWHAGNLILDSACSSSLVSVHLACQALRAGELDAALAGGVEVLLDEAPFVTLAAAGVLSPNGRCATFSEHADGFVPGEGAALLLLKRLDDAVHDGDRIYAVLRGSAIGNDGHTMGITTPNMRAQIEVITAALDTAGVSPDALSYIEAHGTGTMIGDPIELKALATVLGDRSRGPQPCAVGSVKTNIGHLLSAAGIAGAVKTILAVHHGALPPSLHCENLNPRFAFAGLPLYINRELRQWRTDDGRPRAAGVSSFGFGGTNAHLIVEEAPGAHRPVRNPLSPPVFRKRSFMLPKTVPSTPTDPGPRFVLSSVPTTVAPTVPTASFLRVEPLV